jgi:hypothetical protein
MPPLYTYTFENVNNDNISVIIRTYSYDQAFRKLSEIVKNPLDFKQKS